MNLLEEITNKWREIWGGGTDWWDTDLFNQWIWIRWSGFIIIIASISLWILSLTDNGRLTKDRIILKQAFVQGILAANIEKSADIGEGTQIFMGSNICSDVQIAENCIINTGSIVSHDCNLSRNVHLTPGAVLAGYVNIGKNTLIGMLSSVYLGINIGENVIVHNNTRITKNIDSGSIISDNH